MQVLLERSNRARCWYVLSDMNTGLPHLRIDRQTRKHEEELPGVVYTALDLACEEPSECSDSTRLV